MERFFAFRAHINIRTKVTIIAAFFAAVIIGRHELSSRTDTLIIFLMPETSIEAAITGFTIFALVTIPGTCLTVFAALREVCSFFALEAESTVNEEGVIVALVASFVGIADITVYGAWFAELGNIVEKSAFRAIGSG